MYFYYALFLLFYLTCTVTSHPCMQENKQPCTIIDRVDNQAINKTDLPQRIYVFGATPRYSNYCCYTHKLYEDYSSLLAQYQRNKSLKGVTKNIKQFVCEIKKSPGLEKLKTYLEQATPHQRVNLFLSAGINRCIIKQNVETLLQSTISSAISKSCLVHFLLPSYFTDTNLGNTPQDIEQLYVFLKESAQFYNRLYTHSISRTLNTVIVIPPLHHFFNAMNKQSFTKLECNLHLLYKELLEPLGPNHDYILLDQNGPELEQMVKHFEENKIYKVSGIQLALKDSRGFSSTIFTPYLVTNESKTTYQTSPLFNDQLIEHARNIEENNHE
ncbi:hypothetical protein Noda2021_08670 [Candidatus Dependentiae bacterium Noda2021]|nr:hypothetical protein Noda2021_08670 [Candidatus Dependentiae bacterium Noda2021]